MGRLFFGKNGEVGEIPHSKERAREARRTIYDSKRFCTACKDRGVWPNGSSAKFVVDDTCAGCARFVAEDLYNLAVGASTFHLQDGQRGLMARMRKPSPMGASEYYHQFIPLTDDNYQKLELHFNLLPANPMPTTAQAATERGLEVYITLDSCRHGHTGLRRVEGGCLQCWVDKNTPSPRKQALAEGRATYLPKKPCGTCGQHAEKRVHNGSCLNCEALYAQPKRVSLRQAAIAEGRSTYLPKQPCDVCRTHAEKRVVNGSCLGCEALRKQKRQDGRSNPDSPDAQMMRDTSDIVIGREMAKGLGFKVFRTGKACKRGHTGFRYVSTGGCLDCHKDR